MKQTVTIYLESGHTIEQVIDFAEHNPIIEIEFTEPYEEGFTAEVLEFGPASQ